MNSSLKLSKRYAAYFYEQACSPQCLAQGLALGINPIFVE